MLYPKFYYNEQWYTEVLLYPQNMSLFWRNMKNDHWINCFCCSYLPEGLYPWEILSEILNPWKSYYIHALYTYLSLSDVIILIFIGLISGVFCVAACRVHRQYRRRMTYLRTLSDEEASFRYSDLKNGDSVRLVDDTSEDEFD